MPGSLADAPSRREAVEPAAAEDDEDREEERRAKPRDEP